MNVKGITVCILLISVALSCSGNDASGPDPADRIAASIDIAPDSTELVSIGDTAQLSATVRAADGSALQNTPVLWTSLDPDVAEAHSGGRIVALSNGVALVRAAAGDAVDTAVVVVKQVASVVNVTPGAASVFPGDTVEFSAQALDARGHPINNADVIWSSRDATLASVDPSGVATAHSMGTVVVEAAVHEAVGEATMTVRPPPASIVVESGNEQSGYTAMKLAESLAVKVLDAQGEPIEGVEVSWTVVAGGGSLSTSTSETSASGITRVEWTLGALPDTNAVTAAVRGLSATFTAVAHAPVAVLAGDGESATMLDTIPVSIRVVEPTGAPSIGDTVVFQVSAGYGNFAHPAPDTWVRYGWDGLHMLSDSSGTITVNWILGTASPDQELTITRPGFGPIQVTASATGTPIYFRPATFDVGWYVACALSDAGETSCWEPGPIQVPTLNADYPSFEQILSERYSNGGHMCGLTASGLAYCWGDNHDGRVGDGTLLERTEPTPVAGELQFSSLAIAHTGIANQGQTCGILSDGTAYCWGANDVGQLGDGTTQNRSTPTPVAGGTAFIQIAAGLKHTCGLAVDGVVYCWGDNEYGQLGDGSFAGHLTPEPVGGDIKFSAIGAGLQHTCGLTVDGLAYCWGRNRDGRLGDGSTSDRPSPTAVTGGHTFAALTLGGNFTCGLSRSGAVHCWGYNASGQLGDGTTTNRAEPTPVAGGLTFKRIVAGTLNSCGLAADDGVLYCWGAGGRGIPLLAMTHPLAVVLGVQ